MTQFKYHTISKKVPGDLLTPVTAYLNVRDLYSQSVLMESSDYHGGENSKSFIAINPVATVSIAHGKGYMLLPDGKTVEHVIDADYDAHGLQAFRILSGFSLISAMNAVPILTGYYRHTGNRKILVQLIKCRRASATPCHDHTGTNLHGLIK